MQDTANCPDCGRKMELDRTTFGPEYICDGCGHGVDACAGDSPNPCALLAGAAMSDPRDDPNWNDLDEGTKTELMRSRGAVSYYVIRLPDGQYLGRLNLDTPMGPVPAPHAYTYEPEDRDIVDQLCEQFDGTVEAR